MDTLYQAITGIHNLVGIITLLTTLVAGGLLLARRSTAGSSAVALRSALISASTQGTLGLLLVILGLVSRGLGYVGTFWFHYLLGLITVGVVSAFAGRARRASDREAGRYGGILLGIVVLVAITYYVGFVRTTIPLG